MPHNAEYVIAAYGIVITVIVLYIAGIRFKLSSIRNKLENITQGRKDEGKKP